MKKRIVLMLAAAFLAALVATALSVSYPKPTGYITDTTGAIDAATKRKLIPILQALHAKTTAQVGVAVVDTIGGGSVEEYAVKLFEKWGIGTKGKDNGVLLLVALNDRKMRIEVGYGLESVLPDAKAGAIMDDVIKPKFKAGDVNGGIVAGVEAIAVEIVKEYKLNPADIGIATAADAAPTAATRQAPPKKMSKFAEFMSGAGFILIIVILIVLVVILRMLFGRRGGGSGGGYVYSSGGSSDSDSGSDSGSGSSSDSGSDSFDGGGSGGGGASSDW